MKTINLLVAGISLALSSSAALAQVNCAQTFGPTDQALPAEFAVCAPAQAPFVSAPLAPTDTAFVNNLGPPVGGPPVGIHSHILNNFPASLTFRGTTNPALFSMDFNPDGSILWGAVVSTDEPPTANNRTFGQINQTTGAYTSSGVLTGFINQAAERASDLTINPANGDAFLITNEGNPPNVIVRLYRVNLGTGALILAGSVAAQPSFMIDGAINCQGDLFGHQFAGVATPSNFVRISTTTGAVTNIGSTGFAANFAQGMDFDAESGTLYMYHFEGTAVANVILRYGTVNLATGVLTPIVTTAAGAGITLEGAVRSACPAGATPPTFTYTPPAGSTVTSTGGDLVGSTSNFTITPAIGTAGVGTGAPATSTLTCTAPTAPFTGFGQTITATGPGAISGGPLTGTCTRGATAVTQTLTCALNRGGTTSAVSWTLNCPAGTIPPPVAVAVNATSIWSLIALMLALFGVAAVAVRRQG